MPVLLTTAALAMSCTAVAQEQEQEQVPPPQQGSGLPPGQVPAVLKAREVSFTYRSSSRLLTCAELRNHVAVILQAVGARQDVQVKANECEAFLEQHDTLGGAGPADRGSTRDPLNRSQSALDRVRPGLTARREQSTPVRIQLMMPVELTPGTLAQIDQDKSRRELVSRVTGNANAALDEPIFFAAERRSVTLSHNTIKVDATDCELLDQMATTVFRELDLKVTSQALSCDPRQRSRLLPQLTVEALLPVGFQMPGEQKK